jgi:hypothetical protein
MSPWRSRLISGRRRRRCEVAFHSYELYTGRSAINAFDFTRDVGGDRVLGQRANERRRQCLGKE